MWLHINGNDNNVHHNAREKTMLTIFEETPENKSEKTQLMIDQKIKNEQGEIFLKCVRKKWGTNVFRNVKISKSAGGKRKPFYEPFAICGIIWTQDGNGSTVTNGNHFLRRGENGNHSFF